MARGAELVPSKSVVGGDCIGFHCNCAELELELSDWSETSTSTTSSPMIVSGALVVISTSLDPVSVGTEIMSGLNVGGDVSLASSTSLVSLINSSSSPSLESRCLGNNRHICNEMRCRES